MINTPIATNPIGSERRATARPQTVNVPWPLSFEPAVDDATVIETRAATVKRAKTYLKDHRIIAQTILRQKGGIAAASYLSQAQDELIQALFEQAITAHPPQPNEKISFIAVGGYGRGTLAPGSDVDLLILYPAQTPWTTAISEHVLYILWDIGLKVGHATRSVDECIKAAKDDMTIRTAVLESRLICGHVDVFDKFWARFSAEIMPKTASEFVHAKLAERDERVKKAGSSRYLVEPNVKEGKGGLRDLNTLFWIAKYVYRVRSVDELVEAGLFTKNELIAFNRCEEFLWRSCRKTAKTQQ